MSELVQKATSCGLIIIYNMNFCVSKDLVILDYKPCVIMGFSTIVL